MSDSSLYSDYIMTRQRVDQLERVESTTSAYLTLRRTSTLSISSAGTQVTWQTEDQNLGFTWSGTSITIPATGYYAIGINATIASAVSLRAFVNLGVTRVVEMTSDGFGNANNTFFILRQFTASDDLRIELLSGGGTSLNVVAYGSTNESPFLHIVRVA